MKRRYIKKFTWLSCLSLGLLILYFNLKTPLRTIPKEIQEETGIALSYFKDLKDIPIEFKFKKNIKKSVMMAQPTFSSLFRPRSKRAYVILISEKFKINNQKFKTTDVPKDVLIGWLGHELGHVMDYQEKNNWQMIVFGIRYVLFKEHVKSAERSADSLAVANGMAPYILKTKDFILNNAAIDQVYKNRIKQYYLSPEEIRELVKELGKD
ncbi:hypothetical protein BUL40_10865 [Croceivirga radicis]|uniref:Peptidase M48 domain-containing protein n=1 Tax=Croceivirga radicis TaxID=1929488 RepID=A0A1V6LQN8_9FLAO|nr:hypothetical protein [Croceivirga radicis]OQD42266.1 hypothetical protein BUL40_10865 [Croceivirga radicis]